MSYFNKTNCLNGCVFLHVSHFSSVEDLKSKFCSTVANDIMLVSTLGVIRMWADEASRKSRFRILFTTYQERKTRPLAQLLFIIMKDDGCKMTQLPGGGLALSIRKQHGRQRGRRNKTALASCTSEMEFHNGELHCESFIRQVQPVAFARFHVH